MQKALAIDHEEALGGFRFREAVPHHAAADLHGDAAACGSGAQKGDAHVGDLRAGRLGSGQQGAVGNRRRALNVVVEGQQAVAVTLQDRRGVLLRKVLPLQENLGIARLDALDEQVDEVVVLLAADPFVAPADVERIVQTLLVVGADVQHDRQRGRRIDAAAGRIERKFADRDAQPAGALVAQAQDPFAIGDDDGLDVVEWRVLHDFVHDVAPRIGHEQAARATIDLTELLACLADGRCIDQRQHFGDVAANQCVEQRLVGVLELAQIDVLAHRRVLGADGLIGPLELAFEVFDMRWQEAEQAELVALFVGERGRLVEQRIVQQRAAALFHVDRTCPRHRLPPIGLNQFGLKSHSQPPRPMT